MLSYVHRGLRPQVDPAAYGVSRQAPAANRMARQAAWFAAHQHDTPAGTDQRWP